MRSCKISSCVGSKKKGNKAEIRQKKRVDIRVVLMTPGTAAELEQPAAAGEDDERDLGVAQDGQLVGLLEQPAPPLRERHLPVDLVLDPPQLDPPSPHVVVEAEAKPSLFFTSFCFVARTKSTVTHRTRHDGPWTRYDFPLAAELGSHSDLPSASAAQYFNS
ncbi:hypothetical protein BHE74_00038385 [Ensete ventricosum]|nr:hypothetical protein BHE74_00038385 [Ensete ventricosum]RZS05796.1 hypothetical protein BHM03_00036353 [Ensete ventricosum]